MLTSGHQRPRVPPRVAGYYNREPRPVAAWCTGTVTVDIWHASPHHPSPLRTEPRTEFYTSHPRAPQFSSTEFCTSHARRQSLALGANKSFFLGQMAESPDQETYRRALRGMELSKALSPTYLRLLRAHHAAPNHTLTTLELAAAMGWDTHSPVNAQYGTFAAKLAQRMRWMKPPGRPEADAIATFGDGGPEDPHARWIMHPPLARALEELRIVRISQSLAYPHTFTPKSIVELLDKHHQRATYGAVAGLLGKAPRSVMQRLPRDWKHSWVVNQSDGEPSDYAKIKKHPARHERARILSTPEELAAWLANPQ